ncbi:MAG: hypothetical protein JWN40_2116 [Phycisphaerales bacterium]|nr:hypothetical protein [Phycisphaerales bacterium]
MNDLVEKQLTTARHGHVLTNTAVWSPDGQWIVYDVRSDPAGSTFDGDRIEQVNVETGEVQVLYRAQHGAKCGVATYHPATNAIAFILGPENPTPDWDYGPNRRQGVIVQNGSRINLDARDLTAPFTLGALRGGTHVHVFSANAHHVSFTYNNYIIDPDQRNVGVSVIGRPVRVQKDHPRNHDGEAFSVLVTRTTAHPRPGSDEIRRAVEDSWVGTDSRAIAFQGEVITASGAAISEVFIVDLPEDLTNPGDAPLEGTTTQLPAPPKGTTQRRLTFTANQKHPGLSAPRHWLRSSPDGSRIAFLMKDDAGVVQIWTISPIGGQMTQLTHNSTSIASAFTWSPDGRSIAHVLNGSVAITDVTTGATHRLTSPENGDRFPRPEACVFSPDGAHIAYVKTIDGFNQIFVVALSQR